jgi:acyl transferase domain-containing protein
VYVINSTNGVNGTNDFNGIHNTNGNNGAHGVNGVNGSNAINGDHGIKSTNNDNSVNGHQTSNGSHETEEQTDKPPFLVFTSGASRDSRDKNTLNLLEFLKSHDECRTLTGPLIAALNARSNIHIRPWKSFAVAQSIDDLIQQLEGNALKSNQAPRSGGVPRILFTFTGQGAMWSKMGKRLLEAFPVARNTLYELDRVVKELQSSKIQAWSLIGTFDLPT